MGGLGCAVPMFDEAERLQDGKSNSNVVCRLGAQGGLFDALGPEQAG